MDELMLHFQAKEKQISKLHQAVAILVQEIKIWKEKIEESQKVIQVNSIANTAKHLNKLRLTFQPLSSQFIKSNFNLIIILFLISTDETKIIQINFQNSEKFSQQTCQQNKTMFMSTCRTNTFFYQGKA
jgi:hypothetical protein